MFSFAGPIGLPPPPTSPEEIDAMAAQLRVWGGEWHISPLTGTVWSVSQWRDKELEMYWHRKNTQKT